MDLFANLWLGFAVAVSPLNLAYLFAGVMLGMWLLRGRRRG